MSSKKVCCSPKLQYPVNVNLFEKRVLADVIKLKGSHTGLELTLNPMICVLRENPCEHRDVTVVSEVEVTLPQAKECRGLLATI